MLTRTSVLLLLAALLLIPSPAPANAAAGSFTETEIWNAADPSDAYARFHVHGFAVVRAGTPLPATGGALAGDVVLALTEGRYTDCDCSEKDLLLRRSVDAGHTWGPSEVVVADDPTTNTYANPTLLVDERTGSVFLFYSGRGGMLFYQRSDDAGATWGARVDLSALYANDPNGWRSHGSRGHGIQLAGGRLLLPVGHKATGDDPRYGEDMLYSDDHGATWRRGAPVPVSDAYPIGESRVHERADGTVVVLGRWNPGGTRYPITSTSTDGGATWAAPVLDGAAGQFVSVDAGLIRFTAGGVTRLLHSRPDASARENMTVSVSYDEGASYRYSGVVHPGPSYYSDLAVLSDGTILLLYGNDGASRGFPERVTLARFDLEWLTNGRDSVAAGPGLTRHEYELATPAARTAGGPAPQLVADANARGGKRVRHAATAGDYVEVPFEVPAAGSYEVAVRHHRLRDRGRIRTSVDGLDLPAGRIDPTMTVGEGYQVYPLGTMTLAPGTHRIRFTLEAAGRAGGTVIAPDQLALTAGASPADAPRTVADNSAAASFEIASGTWDNDATGVDGYYGQFYSTHPAGTGTATARFRPDVPETGVYEVAVWYPAHPNRASNAPFTVRHAEGQATFRIDQRTQGSQWVRLGSFPFVAGGAATVGLSDDADGYVVADAVRLLHKGTILDNGAAGFETLAGTWNKATGVAGYRERNYLTTPAGTPDARVRWQLPVPAAGVYQVAVWYTAHDNRAPDAPYTVRHAGGATTVAVDQRTRGGTWVAIGDFPFEGAGTATVELTGDADGYVVADAVRLLRRTG
ncbi:hypothetical protein Ade02nite_00860 [Paractinoplanes deccanensis]|uniref:exo-alpha-sialidase n=1 Tax=Paractinoplanes deccanensis TaxID=113561 RepID=A0ABQ3XUS8_9ACTN|nr:exo-alpha-sialidase [Actinoplanes deccanensis]GID71445.1 hypothetical protein Ade02nite_00860 [Actinoplanes deccanensis]